ncbi:hypothetical protein B0T21DRAFT_361343 [Apiosordaria backusii]|uniref:Mating-type switching protein swi10 n=1 Tax=Apiosordaria backusii TaxID=314023 RepID=A0AA40K1I9_9PEZI|nr:hypothetical protein B0T21DRAFT_361343 [Apiosordaria backusii]
MEHLKGGLLVASPKGHTGPKLRKKLKKTVSKQRSAVSSWRLGLSSSTSTANNKSETTNKPPVLSLPSPDLSDPKWSEFFKNGGCFYPQDEPSVLSESSEPSKSRANVQQHPIVPELSHLVISDSDAQKRLSLSSSDSPASPRTTMRRRAKTPIFSIGQLEGIPRPSNALARASTVELIADQYRALLESENSAFAESHPESPPSRQGSDGPLSVRRRQSSDHLREESHVSSPLRPMDLVSSSPTSDDETLVSFEEETVYFKPVSFSPEPSPRLPPRRLTNTPALDNLSLQICLDLLTRDLASALASRPSRTNSETSALQVWVMIEAYERLRDQLSNAGLGCEEYGALESMLNLWLRALYSIHDNITGGDQRSESDYGEELGTEDLD